MDTVFVISEFNPFHYGHMHLIRTLHGHFGRVVCLMSGSAVQRGSVAVADKYTRAKAAVSCGADAVFELPFPYCSLSARDFAAAGVGLASALGGGYLGFGAESDLPTLQKAAEVLSDRALIEREIAANPALSYPKAAERVLAAELNAETAPDFLTKPNNILGIEYITAAKRRGNVIPFAVKRETELKSSSEIRRVLSADTEAGLSMLPPESAEVLRKGGIWDGSKLDAVFMAAARLGLPSDGVYGADEGILRHIAEVAAETSAVEELCEKAANATLTKARVRRTLLMLALGAGAEYAGKTPPYALLLAANTAGTRFIAENRKRFAVPVITKPAGYRACGDAVVQGFEFSLRADRILSLASKTPFSPLKASPYIK